MLNLAFCIYTMKKPLFIVLLFIHIDLLAQQKFYLDKGFSESTRFYNQGRELLVNRSNLQGAVHYFNKAIQLNDKDGDFFFGKSQALDLLAQYDSALFAVEKAISLNPKSTSYLEHSGNLLYKMKKYEKAISNYTLAIKYNEFDESYMTVLYFNLGNSYLSTSRYSKAIENFSKSIQFDSNFTGAYHNRGVAKSRLERQYLKSEICSDFQRALELGSKKSKRYISKYCKD